MPLIAQLPRLHSFYCLNPERRRMHLNVQYLRSQFIQRIITCRMSTDTMRFSSKNRNHQSAAAEDAKHEQSSHVCVIEAFLRKIYIADLDRWCDLKPE